MIGPSKISLKKRTDNGHVQEPNSPTFAPYVPLNQRGVSGEQGHHRPTSVDMFPPLNDYDRMSPRASHKKSRYCTKCRCTGLVLVVVVVLALIGWHHGYYTPQSLSSNIALLKDRGSQYIDNWKTLQDIAEVPAAAPGAAATNTATTANAQGQHTAAETEKHSSLARPSAMRNIMKTIIEHGEEKSAGSRQLNEVDNKDDNHNPHNDHTVDAHAHEAVRDDSEENRQGDGREGDDERCDSSELKVVFYPNGGDLSGEQEISEAFIIFRETKVSDILYDLWGTRLVPNINADQNKESEDSNSNSNSNSNTNVSERAHRRRAISEDKLLSVRLFTSQGWEVTETFLDVDKDWVVEREEHEKEMAKDYTDDPSKISDEIDYAAIYVVLPHEQFVWPFHNAGHQVHVRAQLSEDSLDPSWRSTPEEEEQPTVVLESISEEPRVFLVHNFFSSAEADELIQHAKDATGPHALQRSTIGDKAREDRDLSNPNSFSDTRTSKNAWDQDSVLAVRFRHRAFDLLRLPFDGYWSDGLQLVNYQVGELYQAHHDYFPPKKDDQNNDNDSDHKHGDNEYFHDKNNNHNFDPEKGGTNRFATLFLYLNDVPEGSGGFTAFNEAPKLPTDVLRHLSPEARELVASPEQGDPAALHRAESLFGEGRWERDLVKQCHSSLAVKPKKGTALLFYSQTPDGKLDPLSAHSACPVVQGEKWGANLWLWNGPRADKPKPITVGFTNGRHKAGTLMWQGTSLVPQADIEPGETAFRTTYPGHVFSFMAASEGDSSEGVVVWTHTMDAAGGQEQAFTIP